MVCTGDVATNWKQFREAFDDYSIATQLAEKSAEIQAATLKPSWVKNADKFCRAYS